MELAEKRSRSSEKSIVNLQHRRPLFLGNDFDEKVRKYIMTLRYKGVLKIKVLRVIKN